MIKKRWRSKKLLLAQATICLLFFFSIHSQSLVAAESFSSAISSEVNQTLPVLKKGIYLVVGSFQLSGNANKFAERVRSMGYDAKAGMKRDNGLFYVYAFYSPDSRDAVLEKYHFVRRNSQLHDAWIMYVDINREVFEEAEEDIAFEPLETTPRVNPVYVAPPVEEIVEVEEAVVNDEEVVVIAEEVVEPIEEEQPQPGEGTYPYLFNVTNATTLKEVGGFIQIVDAERNQQYQTVNTNKVELVQEPSTASKKILAVCDIFGYIKQQIEFKVDDPLTGGDAASITREGATTIVSFQLQRYGKGDIITMYNVYFYNDAAIMKPESTYELNSLLDMLMENENYAIKLHGHTNGNSPGKIIKLKEDDDNFFTVTENNVSSYGSAQDLSTERALTIKRWLEEQGVDPKRISIKGWGGKKMIYNKNDPLAKRNIRVEVEILRE